MNTESQKYYVVKNKEEQFSIWFEQQEVPKGWEVVTDAMEKPHCLEFITQNWTDLRPASIR